MENVSHQQIYDRLLEVEQKVDTIDTNTKGLVEAIDAMQGAIKVLGWIASAASQAPPLLPSPWSDERGL